MLGTRKFIRGLTRLSLLGAALGPALVGAATPKPAEKCGVPAAARPNTPPASGWATGSGEAERAGRYPGATSAVAQPSGTLPSEMNTSGEAKAPGAVPTPPTTTQAAPPGSAPPPAVPGLPRAKGASREEKEPPTVEAIQAKGEVPEERLLDVGIEIFGPGVDEGDRAKLARSGLSPELRRSEARFIAFHLKKTLESTGNWGAVRVVPGPGEGLELTVSGEIVESNGKRLAVDVEAKDALGRSWLEKRYRAEANPSAYKAETSPRREAFQDLYNRIANDLLQARDDREARDLVTLRRVATLRFAAQLAPEAFAPYLRATRSGRFVLTRLPAEGDSMMVRVASIQDRDQMFVDTLNDHYLTFYEQMSGPYTSWRQYSYEETEALDKIHRDSLIKKLGGAAAVLAGMLMPSNSQGGSMAGGVLVLGGMTAIQKGFQQAQEAGVHTAALKELANSFDGDVAPLLVEVEGEQRKLTGSAEVQFAAWRELLRQVLAVETGKPGDPNAIVVQAPESTY